MAINSKDLITIINDIGKTVISNKEYLTALDAAIGDADHGINLSKGFESVDAKIKDGENKSPEEILKTVAMTLISTVGGASGPLYGTFFLKASGTLKGKDEIDLNDFYNILQVGIDGVKMRGKSEEGQKTMLDSLIPSLNSLKNSLDNNDNYKDALNKLVLEAEHGMEKTKDIIALKGRASYLGERSIGHIDPGATSSYLMLKSVKDSVFKIVGD